MPTLALIRPLPDAYPRALSAYMGGGTIDLDLARTQHRAYVEALRACVDRIVEVTPDHDAPDSVFIEDQAVVARGRALITRSGAPSRRRERQPVAHALQPWCHLTWTRAPATLDGGDVLQLGDTLLVGLSSRTNNAGAEALRRCFAPVGLKVQPVPLPAGLHLKCACSSPAPGIVLLAESSLNPSIFDGICNEIWTVPAAEAYAANVVGARGQVLLPSGYPHTRALLEAAGLQTRPLDLSELRKGDGSLTCMSILLETP